MKTLAQMIDAQQKGQAVKFSNPMMQTAVAAVKLEKMERATRACGDIIKSGLSRLEDAVEHLRIVRKNEKAAKDNVTKIDRAMKFFGETGNPFPFFATQETNLSHNELARSFCREAGLEVPEPDSDAWVIPADWTPAVYQEDEPQPEV